MANIWLSERGWIVSSDKQRYVGHGHGPASQLIDQMKDVKKVQIA